jgi:hypothetical protein
MVASIRKKTRLKNTWPTVKKNLAEREKQFFLENIYLALV